MYFSFSTIYYFFFFFTFLIFNTNNKNKIPSRPIGDHFQVLIKTKKQSHAQITYIQQRDCVVDRINLSGSQVIIGAGEAPWSSG